MASNELADKIVELRREIRRHDRLYYVDAAPEISDLEYDQLLQQLKQWEDENPDLVTPDSPTQRIGGNLVRTITHVSCGDAGFSSAVRFRHS